MRPSTTARRYAEAAFEVAQQDGDLDTWLADLRAANTALAERETALFFRDPNVGREEKLETLNKLVGHLQPHVLNLLRVLAVRQRIQLLPAILREFQELEREARGIAEAQVTVARPVDQAETRAIAQRLGQLTGKRVEVRTQVDPNILGGVVVRIGDKLIDASVAGRLQRLRQRLAM
jgi:F-type H+-transporting ATPase subunit delta